MFFIKQLLIKQLLLVLVLLISPTIKKAFSAPTELSNYRVIIHHLSTVTEPTTFFIPRIPKSTDLKIKSIVDESKIRFLFRADVYDDSIDSRPLFGENHELFLRHEIRDLLDVISSPDQNLNTLTFDALVPAIPENIPVNQKRFWLLQACFFYLKHQRPYQTPSLMELSKALAEDYWDRSQRSNRESFLIGSHVREIAIYADLRALLRLALDPQHPEIQFQFITNFDRHLRTLSRGRLGVADSIFHDNGEQALVALLNLQIPKHSLWPHGLSLVIAPWANHHGTFEILTLLDNGEPPQTLGVRELNPRIQSVNTALEPSLTRFLLSLVAPSLFRVSRPASTPCSQLLEPIQRR